MPTRHLPEDPSLEDLTAQAEALHAGVREGDAEALARVAEFHPGPEELVEPFTGSDARIVVARGYGFASWSHLVEYLEDVEEHTWSARGDPAADPASVFTQLACLTYTSADHPARRERARELREADPAIAHASIHAAAAAGDVEVVRRFLDRDPALVRARGGPRRWEPLLYAMYSRIGPSGHAFRDVVELLLERGADPDAGCLWRGNVPPFTALTGAFGDGEAGRINQPPHAEGEALARLLLEQGADPNDEQTLYNRHFRPANDHLVLLLEHGLGVDQDGPWYRRFRDRLTAPSALPRKALMWAVRQGQLERVRLLVEQGVDFLARDPGGRTLYEVATLQGRTEVAQYLLERGATANELPPREGLLAACMAGDEREVKRLLSKDASLRDQLLREHPDLPIRAVESGRIDAVRIVLDLGFDVNQRTRVTPLHQAAWAGHLPIAKLLLANGADLDARDTEFDATPRDWAAHNHQGEMARFLETYRGAK